MTSKLSALSLLARVALASLYTPRVVVVLALALSACGNKGDLFLVPDEITQQDLLRLEQVLEAETRATDELSDDEKEKDVGDKDETTNVPSS